MNKSLSRSYLVLSLCLYPTASTPITQASVSRHQMNEELVQTIHGHSNEKADLILLLNVLYWSYQRSVSTVRAQEAYRAFLEDTLKIGKDLHATRRNPSKPFTANLQKKNFLTTAKTCYESFDQYRAHAQTYVVCTDYALVTPQCKSTVFTDLIKSIRSHVRSLILTQATIYYELIKTVVSELAHWQKRERDFLSTMYTALPLCAEHGLVYFDKQYVQLSDAFWAFGVHNQGLYDSFWLAVEHERAAIYKTLYSTCWYELKAIDPSMLANNQLFTQDGLVETKIKATLPEPAALGIIKHKEPYTFLSLTNYL